MRVLITGVSGLVGRAIAGRFAGRGDHVIGLGRTAPLELPSGVKFVATDLLDRSAVAAAMANVDAVIHCAFRPDHRAGVEQTRLLNVAGTVNVIAAAEAANVKRAVFMSSLAVYGPRLPASQPPSRETDSLTTYPGCRYALQKAECERLFEHSSLPNVRVRTGIVLGRATEGPMRALLAANRISIGAAHGYPWSVVHHDDLARFVVSAVDSDRTGPVNVAADDPVDVERIAQILGRKIRRVPPNLIPLAVGAAGRLRHVAPGDLETLLRFPLADTALMHGEWEFEPAWSGVETVEDTRLAVTGVTTSRGHLRRRHGRTAYPHQIIPADVAPTDGAPLTYSGPKDLRGEFDTPIDVRFPVYSQTNLAEALPGPSSVLTLDVQCRALRGTTSAVAEILSLPGPLGIESAARLQAVHAHRVYINASGSYHVSLAMPGSNPESMAEQFTGTHAEELPGGFAAVAGTYMPPRQSPFSTARSLARVGHEVVSLIRRASWDVGEVREQTARLERYESNLSGLSDGRLQVLMLLGRDLLAYAWTVQGVVNLVSGEALEVASKTTRNTSVGYGDDLQSSAALRGVRGLAVRAAADPHVMTLLADRSPGLAERVASQAPQFWALVQRALDEFGHRGPGEAEFDARSFADDVQGFLSTIGRAASSIKLEDADDASKVITGKHNWVQRLAFKLLTLREQNRDRVVRLTWLTRCLALEQGRRLVAQGRLERDRDVFNLTLAQLVDPPANARQLVARREKERARLAELHMPPIFSATWESSDVLPMLQPGESISGIGICKGRVVGRARVVDPSNTDELEPDEIMIAHVTDVGYTALFGHCGAVVTDIGGVMSHAAVVAREYGVPCVVDTQVAAARIPSGALVEVDGEAGTVTVLQDI